jgi:hypothetical protein
VQLLEEEGIAHASTNEDFLVPAARSFPLSSHQMSHDFAACVDDWEDADNLLTKSEVL